MGIDSYSSPDAEGLLLAGEQRVTGRRRELRELAAHSVGALGFLVAAGLLAAIVPWHHSLSPLRLALVLAVWVAVERVRFPVAGGWASPTMLVFTPALFLLPTTIVPLVAVVAALLRRPAELARGHADLRLVPVLIADNWYTIGPTLVIVLGGAQEFSWAHWPVYAGAMAAQLVFDTGSAVGRCWIGEGVSPRVQLPLMTWLYIVDLSLAPVGLLLAAAAVDRPALILLALSPAALLALFARERQQRLDAILELSTAYRGTTLLLGDIIEANDAYTGMHSRDVVDLSLGVADALGLNASQRRNVEFGALLHDVGKIRIRKEILNKPGKLDPQEWEFVRRHTIEGEAMLRQVGGKLADLGPIVRASHERWDGHGYPDGLAAEQIPVEARIISACDAFNAMTTDRPYRSAMHRGEALAEMRRCAGSQFDPRVVEALDRRVGAELEAESSHPATPKAGGLEPLKGPRTPPRPGYTALSARL
jgi:HD-GYP domain-containing protein (c-di-GMP phosphodiesterase class II)